MVINSSGSASGATLCSGTTLQTAKYALLFCTCLMLASLWDQGLEKWPLFHGPVAAETVTVSL